MQRTQTQNTRLQSATESFPSCKTAPYRVGGYRRPVYRPDTRFGLSETGRALAARLQK